MQMSRLMRRGVVRGRSPPSSFHSLPPLRPAGGGQASPSSELPLEGRLSAGSTRPPGFSPPRIFSLPEP